jgi:hydrogenase expression/formation protein HypD
MATWHARWPHRMQRRGRSPAQRYSFMEFCGGHTHALARHGVLDLLPDNLRMIHGPGCPVCVLPIGRIDMAIELALRHGVHIVVHLRRRACACRRAAARPVAAARQGACGADIRMVYSPADALQLARASTRSREVVFLAIGFETTTPPTALVIRQAHA